MGLLQKWLSFLIIVWYSSQSLFAQSGDEIIIGKISFTGNRVTHESILIRELEFNQGDTISRDVFSELKEKSIRNLLTLPLFHFASINTLPASGNGNTDIVVDVTERWYTWVWPVFELSDRNFNSWLKKGDLTRLSYGLFFQQENFRGRLEKLQVRIKLGYQQEIMLLYEKPYLNRQKTLGAGLQFSAGRQRETGYATINDKLAFYRADNFLLHSYNIAVYTRWRPDINFSHTLQIRYNNLSAGDSLLKLNPDYTPEGIDNPVFFELSYLFKADFRDQRAYPLKGWYSEISVAKTGLLKADDYHYFSARFLFRGYSPLSANLFLAGSLSTRLMPNINLPYCLTPALGYHRDYVRGYEYYVIDGNNFWVGKLNLKYALIKPAILKLNWPRTEKFNTIPYSLYLGCYFDAGKAWNGIPHPENQLPSEMLYGFGAGLDFVTYYDKVVRAEFSINGKGETGFFLHFMAAI